MGIDSGRVGMPTNNFAIIINSFQIYLNPTLIFDGRNLNHVLTYLVCVIQRRNQTQLRERGAVQKNTQALFVFEKQMVNRGHTADKMHRL